MIDYKAIYERIEQLEHLKEENLLFYDMEVTKHDWLIVFKDINFNEIAVFHSNKLADWNCSNSITGNYANELNDLIKGKTLLAYNNYHYDDIILGYMLKGFTDTKYIKALSDSIIENRPVKKRELPQDTLSIDLFRQIDVSSPSLKKIEGNRGVSIEETKTDFNINRPLTNEEMEEMYLYCSYDVDETIRIFKERLENYLQPKAIIISEIGKRWGYKEYNPVKLLKYNITYLMGVLILGDKVSEKWTEYHLTPQPNRLNYDTETTFKKEWIEQDVDFLNEQIEKGLPVEVVEMWNKSKFNRLTNKFDRDIKNVDVEKFGNTIKFGFGGIHGVPTDKSIKEFKKCYFLDVASLYPNIIINLNVLGEGTQAFKNIVETRLKAKHEGNKLLSNGLKIGINSTFGCLINQYSNLFNAFGGQSVCMYGQIILFDLAKRLNNIPHLKMFNINTDGIGFTGGDMEQIERVWKEWESDYNLTLELDYFHRVIQKDVNNYIGTKIIDNVETVVKAKGSDVSRYKGNMFHRDNSLRIVDKIVVEYFLNGRTPMETVKAHLEEPLLFQKVITITRKFKGLVNEDGEPIENRVNRAFAVHANIAESLGFEVHEKLYKQRENGSRITIDNISDNNIIYNGDLSDLDNEVFKKIINKKYYCDLGTNTLKQWGVEFIN